MMAIFQSLKRSGALQAELVINWVFRDQPLNRL